MSEAAPLWHAVGLLLGLGLAWTSMHCAGMCGPLVVGLRLGCAQDDADEGSRPKRLARVVAQLGAYQLGRAVVYAAFGAAAGWAGGLVGARLHQGALVVGVLLATAFFAAAMARLGWFSRLTRRSTPGPDRPLSARLAEMLPVGLIRRPLAAAAAYGAALAFLPCGIVLWALGLAAASGDALVGALLLATLVALTTPALFAALLAPMAVPLRWRASVRRWAGRWLEPAALAFSGTWILVLAVGHGAATACHQLVAGG